MNRTPMSITAHRKWMIVPLLLWYVLLSSHTVLLLPAFGHGSDRSNQTAAADNVTQQSQPDTPVQSLPTHEHHSTGQKALCVICDVSAVTVDTMPDISFKHLLTLISLDRFPSPYRSVAWRDQTMPVSPVPDPPLKIPISIS